MNFNEQQQSAINASGNVMILAIAGSGKTAVLCARAARVLNASPAARIVLVTFTKQSGDELLQRISALVPDCHDRLIIGTFHSISLQYLTVMGNKSAKLISPSEQEQLLRRSHQLKASHLKYDKFTAYIAGHAVGLSSAERADFSMALQHYLSELEKHQRIDFDSLLKMTVDQIARSSTAPFGASHLMVDEFQDIDQVQLDWITEVTRKHVAISGVGDDDQTIY